MAKDDEKEAKDAEAKGGGKMKLITMLVPLILLLAGAGWYFFLRPTEAAGPVVLPEPTPGVAVALDPITINLAGAHFLKLGMALQPIAGVAEAPSGSKALDLAISQFSGATIDELATAKGREEAKKQLVARIKLAYLPEGTDLATATGAATTAATTSTKETATTEKEDPMTIPGPEAIKLAAKLTVQPIVYDVYLTEFVMQ